MFNVSYLRKLVRIMY